MKTLSERIRALSSLWVDSPHEDVRDQVADLLALTSGSGNKPGSAEGKDHDALWEVMLALEDLSFECFSPIAPCNPPSLATYNRTFEVLDRHRKRLGIHPQSVKTFISARPKK